jgi:hypothetical protein
MMAIEDVGILAKILQRLCKPTPVTPFKWQNLGRVAELYEKIRIPRTTKMLNASQALGDMQLARSTAKMAEIAEKELEIKRQVREHGTLPTMFFGARYKYQEEVDRLLIQNKL